MADLQYTEPTDDELDELSLVTDQDIIDTHRFMMAALDSEFKNLPLAETRQDAIAA